MDNLERVAVLDTDFGEARSGDDLPIAFDRDLRRIDPDLVQHFSDSNPAGDSAVLAVHSYSNAHIDAHHAKPIEGALTLAKSVQGGRKAHRLTERCAKL
jgi:hypothetical protein